MKFLESKLNSAMKLEKQSKDSKKMNHLKKLLTVEERKFDFADV